MTPGRWVVLLGRSCCENLARWTALVGIRGASRLFGATGGGDQLADGLADATSAAPARTPTTRRAITAKHKILQNDHRHTSENYTILRITRYGKNFDNG